MNTGRFLLAIGILLLLAVHPRTSPGCGPFSRQALFTFKYHIWPIADEYAGGRIGILQPTYWRKFLFVAYRYLSDNPLSEEEQRVWLGGETAGTTSKWVQVGSHWVPVPIKTWLDARLKVPGTGEIKPMELYRPVTDDSWQSYLNCGEDAFETATAALQDRILRFGAGHPAIRSWVDAQDAVFSNCSGGEFTPSPADPGLPALFRFDRAYQGAAAYFYSARLDDAILAFGRIASDGASPWSAIAPYLQARAFVRKATLTAGEDDFHAGLMKEAEQNLRSILSDPARKEIHPAAERLQNFVALRLHPQERLTRLTTVLQERQTPEKFKQDLIDYQYLLDRIPSEPASKAGEMTEWIVTFQDQSEPALAHALARWKGTRNPAWLLVSAAKIPHGHPEVREILNAARDLARDSPAYATVAHHRIRIMMDSGNTEEARHTLDSLLPELRRSQSGATLNHFLAQRLLLAESLDRFIEFAPRSPAALTNAGYESEWSPLNKDIRKPLFDADSVRVFNYELPLSLLRKAVGHSALAPHLQGQLAGMTWVRAVLMENREVAREVSDALARYHPEAAPYLNAYRSASDAEQRKFAAAYLLLKLPGMKPYLNSGLPRDTRVDKIDNLRDNWWCSFSEHLDMDGFPLFLFRRQRESRDAEAATRERSVPPVFLGGRDREAMGREWSRLLTLDTGPNYLAAAVAHWARRYPNDPRVPEALHLAVKATRFGCTNERTGDLSRQAFRILHRSYPGSEWAKRTPYWYK